VSLLGFLVTPRKIALPAPGGVSVAYANPIAIRSLGPVASAALIGTLPALALVSVALLAAAFVALVVRYRGGDSELRQQIRWLALVAVAGAIAQVALLLAQSSCRCQDSPLTLTIGFASAAIALIGVPLAIAIAILRYGLYRIDVLLSRTVLYGLLATALTAVYIGIVAGVGAIVGDRGGSALTIAAAIAVALLFQPLRERARRLANRAVYGERASPYEVLSELAERMGATYALDDVLQRTAAALAGGTGATRADVWLRVGEELRNAATWPEDGERHASVPVRAEGAEGDVVALGDGVRGVMVRHDRDLLGALSVRTPRDEPLAPTEEKLVRDLASQAGLVLRNVRLATELQWTIDELRESRRRLVDAQDEERRRIERNLHDGAQQQLVALGVQLGLPRPPGRRSGPRSGCGWHAPRGRATRARRSPGSRPWHLSAAARRQGARTRARGTGSTFAGADDRRDRRHRAVRARGRGRGLLLRAGGHAERCKVRAKASAAVIR